MTTPTQLPIPSNNLLDSRFNFEKLDQIVNSDANFYVDRFGKQRLTAKGLEDLINRIEGEFENNVSSPDGYRLIGKATSFEQLRTIRPLVDGQRILLTGYRDGWGFGGGEFEGFFGTVTDDGGITAAGDGFYWRRIDRNSLNLYQFGAYGDNVNDDTPAYKRMVAHIRSLPSSRAAIIDGEGRTFLFTEGIEIDVGYFILTNMTLNFTTITADKVPTGGNFYAVTITTTRRGYVDTDYRTLRLRDLQIVGPAFNGAINGALTKIHALYFKTDTTLNGFIAENILVRYFHTAIVWSSHSYLQTFSKCRLLHCYAAVSDTKVLEGVDCVDCGENLVFNGCVFDMNVYNLYFVGTNAQWEVRFNYCSFDYFGGYGDLGTIYPFDMSTTQLLWFNDCHFEWGNASSKVSNMFRCGGMTVVEINGGVIRPMSGGNYGTVDLFFYNTGTASFSINETIFNRAGVTSWANFGLYKFRPRLKDANYIVSGVVNTLVPNSIYNIQDANLVHPYSQLEFEVRGLDNEPNTDPHTHPRVTATLSTVTVGGKTYPSILLSKQAGYGVGSYCDFKLYVDRTAQGTVLNGCRCSIIAATVGNPRTLSGSTGAALLNVKGADGMYPTYPKTTPAFGSSIALTTSTTTEFKFNPTPVLVFNANGHQMNKIQLRFDLTGLGASESIHIFNIADYGPL